MERERALHGSVDSIAVLAEQQQQARAAMVAAAITKSFSRSAAAAAAAAATSGATFATGGGVAEAPRAGGRRKRGRPPKRNLQDSDSISNEMDGRKPCRGGAGDHVSLSSTDEDTMSLNSLDEDEVRAVPQKRHKAKSSATVEVLDSTSVATPLFFFFRPRAMGQVWVCAGIIDCAPPLCCAPPLTSPCFLGWWPYKPVIAHADCGFGHHFSLPRILGPHPAKGGRLRWSLDSRPGKWVLPLSISVSSLLVHFQC